MTGGLNKNVCVVVSHTVDKTVQVREMDMSENLLFSPMPRNCWQETYIPFVSFYFPCLHSMVNLEEVRSNIWHKILS